MKIQMNSQALLDITPGSYVFVEPDLSPTMCSYKGNGLMMEVNGDGILVRTVMVKYDEAGSSGGKTELDIPYSHLTAVPTTPFASPKLVCKC